MPRELNELWEALQGTNPGVPLPKMIEMFKKAIVHYAEIAKPHMGTRESRMNLAYTFEKEIDKIVENLPQDGKDLIRCRKGCAHCCKMFVAVSKPEAELLLAISEQEGITINKEYLKKQIHLGEGDYSTKPELARCVFLDKDDTCKIYEYRPMACRKYLVSTNPKYCNVQKYPKTKVASLFMADAETIEAGMAMVDEFQEYSMPKALLIVMEEQEK